MTGPGNQSDSTARAKVHQWGRGAHGLGLPMLNLILPHIGLNIVVLWAEPESNFLAQSLSRSGMDLCSLKGLAQHIHTFCKWAIPGLALGPKAELSVMALRLNQHKGGPIHQFNSEK